MPSWSRKLLALISFATVLSLCAASYINDGIMGALLSGDLDAEAKVAAVRTFFEDFGAAAPLVYVGVVTVEVMIAPIPGTMLYAPGGIVFGGFLGGLLSLTGNVIGAGLSCALIRMIGRDFVERHVSTPTLARYESLLAAQGIWIVLLLRINPLTSSDLVSYGAGLTRMPVWKVMVGTLLGMAPLCWIQAYIADELLSTFPKLLYPLVVACGIYTAAVIWVIRRMLRSRKSKTD
jgi:uncharacterized membrane protein YdjX (TVP38/TMEM64 family)